MQLDFALGYARQGLKVFPLKPQAKAPLTARGFHDASTDEKQIESWWATWPEANIGMPTGRENGLVVVDVDRHNGKDGTAVLSGLQLPATRVIKTPRNGYHFIFRYPPEATIGRVIDALPGIDLLGDDGYVVAPGSVVDGKYYQILRDREPVDCPPQVIALARPKPKVAAAVVVTGTIPEGGRNAYLASCAGSLRRINLDAQQIKSVLLIENAKRCSPPLEEKEVEQIAASVARYEPAESLSPDSPCRQPTPLVREIPAAAPYPIDALGEVLAPAARAIAEIVQVPEAMAANSVLATAALACQVHADVMTLGGTRPLSLYILTVAGSGDRKTAADQVALAPIHEHVKRMSLAYRTALAEHERALEAHKLDRTRKRQESATGDVYAEALAEITDEPAPRLPWIVCSEPTAEGLMHSLADGQYGQGIYSDEGGQFVGGHALSEEAELRSIAMLSRCWQGAPLDRVRATDHEHIVLYGRRLSMHLMAQPAVATRLLAKPLYRSQGFLARWLIAAPESLAGTRRHDSAQPLACDDMRIRRYYHAIAELLARPAVEDHEAGGLNPACLALSPEARAVLIAAYDEIEVAQASGGELESVREWAAKGAEHACRIAGVLTMVRDPQATHVGLEAMQGALHLVQHYLGEYERLVGMSGVPEAIQHAKALLDWLQRTSRTGTTAREIMRNGPRILRSANHARTAVATLVEHGWLRSENAGRYAVCTEGDA